MTTSNLTEHLNSEKIQKNGSGYLAWRLAWVAAASTSHIEVSAVRAEFRK
jgi:hypothetical protein